MGECGVDEECCWVCLGAGSPDEPLARPCACPRHAHSKCLARWMLQCAGRSEEKQCRFCNQAYAMDWKETLAPAAPLAPAVMKVVYLNQVHHVPLHPGPDGRAKFEEDLRRVLKLRKGDGMTVTFKCHVPDSTETVSLEGMEAFDAAAHCAALKAAKRKANQDAGSPGGTPTTRTSSAPAAGAASSNGARGASRGPLGPDASSSSSSAVSRAERARKRSQARAEAVGGVPEGQQLAAAAEEQAQQPPLRRSGRRHKMARLA